MLKTVLLLALLIAPLSADQWLSIGGGVAGIVRPKDQTPMIQIEYQPEPLIHPISWFNLRPQLGFFMTLKTASYFYGGFRFEFLPTKHFMITPGFAAGLYIKGHGKRLHFPIEYKSSIEAAWTYRQNSRKFSAQFYHISNASIGFHNPGTEMIVFSYCIKI